jgi:hypothetical protein
MTQYVARPSGAEADLIGVAEAGQLISGAQVHVQPSEAAVFVKDGYARGMLGPGRHLVTESSPLAAQLLAPGATTICFVSTTPIAGIEVGGSLGRLADPVVAGGGQVRAYAEITVQVIDPESFVAAALPSTSQDALGWLNAKLLQGLQRTVTQLVASGEVNAGTLASSTALVDHHLCAGATELEAAGVRVVEVTDVKVPRTDGGEPPAPTGPAAAAAVPAGKTVLGDVPLEAFADSSSPDRESTAAAGGASVGPGGGQPGWQGPAGLTAPATYEHPGSTPAAGGSGMYGYGDGGAAVGGSHGYEPTAGSGYAGGSSGGSGCVIGGMLLGLAAVLLGALAAVAFWSAQSTTESNDVTATQPVTAIVWDGRSRFSCSSGSKRIQNVTAAVTRGAAINATGSCSLLLENVDIRSAVGIRATDHARVTVDGGSIRGRTHSIEVGSQATVYLKGGATVRGSFKKSGSGKVLRIKDR